MIKIVKAEAPVNLVRRGQAEKESDLEKFNAEIEKYLSGELKFEAKDSIYNSDAVRNTLEGLQYNKCCYCETKSTRSNIDVEHYRPKTAYSTDFIGGNSKYPGYFWLAYDWDNLFLACQVCNQVFKNDFFPLENEDTRAQLNDLSIDAEKPIFVHPSLDEPEDEIEYIESIPRGKKLKGKLTIAYLGFGSIEHGQEFNIDYSPKLQIRINRLKEEREKYYNTLKLIFNTIRVLENKILNEEETQTLISLRKLIEDSQSNDSEWASMARYAVKSEFKFY
jgi:uncharacterized protein (TIGR02646 family)